LFTVTTYILPEKLRKSLSRPIGDLLRGSDIDLHRVLRELVANEKPPKLILVGDTFSRRAYQGGIRPDVVIVDNIEKRKPAEKYPYPEGEVIHARNQAGMIEPEARLAVERAVRGEAARVEIDGEEDLLALIAAKSAPIGSLIVYGQPNEGVVIVKISKETKSRVDEILKQMNSVS